VSAAAAAAVVTAPIAISLSRTHYRRAEHATPNVAPALPLPKAQNHGLDAPEGLPNRAPNRRSGVSWNPPACLRGYAIAIAGRLQRELIRARLGVGSRRKALLSNRSVSLIPVTRAESATMAGNHRACQQARVGREVRYPECRRRARVG
jgi:hypothetical protein